jgi:meso-butanediol dehydrogenase / (S,S)-butanediol dehydrogenase / diacetyl reductase
VRASVPCMGRFDGKVALLTGAGSGIGQATTLRLASEGASVFAVDVNPAGLDETSKLASDDGLSISTHVADVTSREACRGAVDAAVAEFGRLDILGNIAGVARCHHFTDVTPEEWALLNGVNVEGPIWLSQAAIPHLLESHGNIVNIASNAGLMGQAYTVPYCITKGAIIQLTRGLAMEYVKTPLRVNAIAPGGVDTTLARTFQIPSDVDFTLMQPYTGFRDMAQAADIAALFAFVASDEARNIHGAILSTDSGITAG